MISMPSSTKEQYKDFERELQVYGNLYLAKKRVSYNLYDNNVYSETGYLTNDGNRTADTSWEISEYISVIPGEKITISGMTTPGVNPSICFYNSSKTYLSGTRHNRGNPRTFTIPNNCYYIRESINVNDKNTTMIAKGETTLDYEKFGVYVFDYTLFPLTEENEAKILSFNINEKCDVYYTSLPYNIMTIEIDNEKGYFTDYDPDSIVNKLNSDCYVELFMKINDDDYYRIMKMNFNEISYSDYEKAKLSFKSCISKLKNLILKDNLTATYFTTGSWSRNKFSEWLSNIYGITYNYSGSAGSTTTINTAFTKANSVENMILGAGTFNGTLSTAVLTFNDTNDYLCGKFWGSSASDTITKDYELEKPILKRENTYNGVDYTLYANRTFTTSSENYSRTITGTLNSAYETIVIRDNDYDLYSLTDSDIFVSTGITFERVNYSSNRDIVILKLNGTIGQDYSITLTKSSIKKTSSYSLTKSSVGNISDTAKTLTIQENSPLYKDYYNLILNEYKIKSYVEAQIIGLPYLELGDTIEIETDNANVLTTISEINMEFDGGLTMTIKGYELGWDALFPSDTLYPSDDLYPNTTI